MASARYAEIDWYQTPRWYDMVFDADTAHEADFLVGLAAQHGLPAYLDVLEPACGSGRLVAELAARGHRVSGFDLSAAMLDFARARLSRRKLRARLFEGDMARFATRERFHLAHCLVSTFKYLQSEQQARAHLECVARALVRGGIYVLGFHLSDYASKSSSRERWRVVRGATEVVCNTQVWPAERRARSEAVRTRLCVRTNGRELRSETRWRFRTYDERQVRSLLRSVPAFEHVATHDFGHELERTIPFDGEQLDVVLVLRKR